MKKLHILAFSTLIVISAAGVVSCGWLGEASDVAYNETSPKALLKKYEWFKDCAAACDKHLANIKVYETRIAQMKEDYKDQPRSKWPRTDLEQMNVWQSEVAGVKATYNQTAADYNAQMAKANWDFCNVGKLPAGATTPLPRAIKPYVEQ